MSSSLNFGYSETRVYLPDGSFINPYVELQDVNGRQTTLYAGGQCTFTYNVTLIPIHDVIDHAFDDTASTTLVYEGLNSPDWDTENVYHQVTGYSKGTEILRWLYTEDTLEVKYLVDWWQGTNVFDYGNGFVERTYTPADFIVSPMPIASYFPSVMVDFTLISFKLRGFKP